MPGGVLGERLKGMTPFSSLQFGVNTRKPPNCTGNSMITYRPRAGGGFEGVFAEDNPSVMYEKLFANLAAAGGAADATRARQILDDRSVLDFAVNEHQQLSRRLPAGDRTRLDEHAAMLRGLKQRLGGGVLDVIGVLV